MPAKSERQRKMMAAAYGRKKKGMARADDPQMSLKKFREFIKKTKKK